MSQREKSVLNMVNKILSSKRKRTSKILNPFPPVTCSRCGNDRNKCDCHLDPNCECDVSHEGSCYDSDDLPPLPQIRIPSDNRYGFKHGLKHLKRYVKTIRS